MKSYKEIRKTIREMHGGSEPYGVFAGRGRVGPQDGDNALDADMNLSSLTPAAIDRINTYLGALSAKPYIDPVSALKQAQGRLQMIGLNFDLTKECQMRLSTQTEDMIPLVRFGGVFGSDGTTYSTSHDDGITPKIGHGLALRVETHKLPNGMTQVQAQIVPN
jgi:hypothetical protein